MFRPDQGWVWRELAWPVPVRPEAATDLLDRLASEGVTAPLIFETRASADGIRHLIAARPSRVRQTFGLLRHLLPGIRFQPPPETRTAMKTAGRIRLHDTSAALNADRGEATVRAVLTSLATANRTDDELVLQVVLVSGLPPMSHKPRPAPMLLPGTPETPTVEQKDAIAVRGSLHGFRLSLRVGAAATSPAREEELIRSLLASLRVADTGVAHLDYVREPPSRLNGLVVPRRPPLALSVRELLPLLGWPVGELPLPGVASPHPRLLPTTVAFDEDRAFGAALGPHGRAPVGIAASDAVFHTEILGPIGSGKSTVLLNLALADIRAGRGVLVIDPKADLVTDLLARIPEERADDVVVIDPTAHRPVGLNPLQDASRSPELVADSIFTSLKSVFTDTWGIRSEDVLGSALLTLTRRRGSTLVELPRLLSDPAYRRSIVRLIDDPLGVGRFWGDFDRLQPNAQATLVAPTLNKLRTILIRPQLRVTLGQSASGFTLEQLFSERKIVLLALNKGVLGAESARLLGSLVVGMLWPLILARAAVPQRDRHVVSVIIDEVQDYLALPTDLADALSQARSLGVAFTLAHQYRGQLPADMKASIDANARNLIVFGLNSPDAGEMAKMAPELTAEDFMALPAYDVYARLMRRGHSTGWLSATTLPAPAAIRDPRQLAAASAARYGRNAREVEAELRARLDPTQPAPGEEDDLADEPIGRRRRS